MKKPGESPGFFISFMGRANHHAWAIVQIIFRTSVRGRTSRRLAT
jgi:hypothetical protein